MRSTLVCNDLPLSNTQWHTYHPSYIVIYDIHPSGELFMDHVIYKLSVIFVLVPSKSLQLRLYHYFVLSALLCDIISLHITLLNVQLSFYGALDYNNEMLKKYAMRLIFKQNS